MTETVRALARLLRHQRRWARNAQAAQQAHFTARKHLLQRLSGAVGIPFPHPSPGQYDAHADKIVAAVLRLRADKAEWKATVSNDPDHCGDPTPSLFGRSSAGWCVRRVGHGAPHRDRDDVEWMQHVEARAEEGPR